MSRQHEDQGVARARDGRHKLEGETLDAALRTAYREGMERAAQIVRYYLKHQNLSWGDSTKFNLGVDVTCKNVEEAINDEVESLAV